MIQKVMSFDCVCGQTIRIPDIKNHIMQCKMYQQESQFFNIFQVLPINVFNESQLLTLKEELKIYIEKIDKQIKGKTIVNNHFCQKMESIETEEVFKEDEQNFNFRVDILECVKCHTKFYQCQDDKYYFLQPCEHVFCKICLISCIDNQYPKQGFVECRFNNCDSQLQDFDYQILLNQKHIDDLQKKFQDNQMKDCLNNLNIVTCQKCQQQLEFQQGTVDFNMKDDNSKLIDQQACIHFSQNRFKCVSCNTDQCKTCHSIPYHKGFTCESFKVFNASEKCRFCELPKCVDDDCKKKQKLVCKKVLECGHKCNGFKDEQECPPCLHCSKMAYEFCNICMCEGLSQAPVIKSSCGHIFHYECVKKNLEMKWFTPRITFGFCKCPLCKNVLEFQKSVLQNLIIEAKKLIEVILTKAMQRLKYEVTFQMQKREKDEKLIQKDSNFYQKPQEYAMAIYSYYMCFKCKVPYYGGLKDCERGIDEQQQQNFKQEDLICPGCQPNSSSESCKVTGHGKEFIQWKCKFCCNIAVFFCWGNTHFCDTCHQKQVKGDYLTKKNKSELPKCPGPEKCPLKTKHKENGEECCIGCQLCINQKQDFKNF